MVDFGEEFFVLEIEEDGGLFDFAELEDLADDFFARERFVGFF